VLEADQLKLLNRVVNLAPADKDAKVRSVLSFLTDHPVKEKPVVIFAGNYASVDMLHAADAHDRLTAEIAKQARRLEPEGNDPDAEAQWCYLLGQRNRAQRVRAVAEDAKSRR